MKHIYMLNAFCANKGSAVSNQVIDDFIVANNSLGINFKDYLANSMLEVILSPHLQDEMDIVLQNQAETSMLFIEAKRDFPDLKTLNDAIQQAERYIDLLQSGILPKITTVYANIVGSGVMTSAVSTKYPNQIKLIEYKKNAANEVRFN